jgi:thiol-disulfide isomerase/thioredoxin
MPRVELIDSRENTDKLLSKLASSKYSQIKNAANRAAFFVGIFAIICGTLFLCGCAKSSKLEQGQTAPEFEFISVEGQKNNLSSFIAQNNSNQNTLLVFWSTWCDVCKHELPQLDQLASSKQIKVLAIAIRDQKDRWLQYTAANKFNNLILGFADTKAVLDKYKGDGVPESVLINKDNKLMSVIDVQGQNVVKMIGPQPWEQPQFYSQLFKQL